MCFRAMLMAYGSTCISMIIFLLYKGDAFIYRFPFSPDNPSQVHLGLLHLFQSLGLFFNTFFVVAGDLWVAIIGIHIMGMLRVLADFIRLLDESSQNHSSLLRRIQTLHADIINHNRIFNDLIFHLLTAQLLSSIFLILMSLSAVKYDAVGFVSYFLGGSSIIQLLLICLFGEIIFMRYSDIDRCLNLTKWYEMSLTDQRNFILILRMGQKPYGLKAGGMYDVSMPTFIDIVKLAISYCAILFAFIE
ncbi:odorant receptor 85f-like [Phlebotomus papatasi]|uniref:odorant receptor 85f-like n=1 Tax=Phlebotomus papatasi TaxID=29031 RepID=UPI0024844EA1|nr:odorant receptor 85f-like [Phlebotomus papatasi]